MGFSGPKGITLPGTPVYIDKEVDSTPGTTQTLFTFQVSAATRRLLSRLKVFSRIPCLWRMTLDEGAGEFEIAKLETHTSNQHANFEWFPLRPIESTWTVELKATVNGDGPIEKISCFLDMSELTV